MTHLIAAYHRRFVARATDGVCPLWEVSRAGSIIVAGSPLPALSTRLTPEARRCCEPPPPYVEVSAVRLAVDTGDKLEGGRLGWSASWFSVDVWQACVYHTRYGTHVPPTVPLHSFSPTPKLLVLLTRVLD